MLGEFVRIGGVVEALSAPDYPSPHHADRSRDGMADRKSIPAGLCQCGCGAQTARVATRVAQGYALGDFYRFVSGHHMKARADLTRNAYVPIHDSSRKHGYVYEHVLRAEQALGRPLPHGAQVHHVDENRRNSANTNLVICENRAYHALLHNQGARCSARRQSQYATALPSLRCREGHDSVWEAHESPDWPPSLLQQTARRCISVRADND